MIQEVLQNCHDSLEGGYQGIARTFYRVKLDYYWIGLYADGARHVRSCPDCSSSNSRPKIRGYSLGNILAERPFQVVPMNFVIPLRKSRRDNTPLLLFQCAFTGYVMGKAMADTTALRVDQAFEECVYRRFGAPSLIRHDRDPRFMSEVFQSFTKMMQSRSRATLSYRPKPMTSKSARASVREDPLQQDWDEIAEKLIFALRTRFYNPFICQTPLQVLERLRNAKWSKGMSTEVCGDVISNLCDAASYRSSDEISVLPCGPAQQGVENSATDHCGGVV
ncbi:reverse transcriptase [Phytophthora megakarya]|uniref:Reverse transcriptase n=1 Tax=Phytophthora megakarya TaxID=4795 RepID=A0A225VB27_9STRA|nr:reverse transcriptase [Phytophthora megakarya]